MVAWWDGTSSSHIAACLEPNPGKAIRSGCGPMCGLANATGRQNSRSALPQEGSRLCKLQNLKTCYTISNVWKFKITTSMTLIRRIVPNLICQTATCFKSLVVAEVFQDSKLKDVSSSDQSLRRLMACSVSHNEYPPDPSSVTKHDWKILRL